MKEKYFLASNNTICGFSNHFADINPKKNAFNYILKGGSGTGKSTFMKQVGKHFLDKGYNVEYFFCSSDPASLDGVRIVEKNVAILDGTAPHTTEATLPEVNDKILNVGEFINPKIAKNKAQIEAVLPKKSRQFAMTYAYLESVGNILKVEKILYQNSEAVCKKTSEILSNLTLKRKKNFKERCLFLSSIDKDGLQNLIAKNKFSKVINLDCPNYILGFEVIQNLCKILSSKKVDYIKILSPLGENFAEGIYLESCDTLVFNNHLAGSLKNDKLIFSLLKKAGSCVAKARSFHKKLEKYYIENMDFSRLTVLREKVIREIEERF